MSKAPLVKTSFWPAVRRRARSSKSRSIEIIFFGISIWYARLWRAACRRHAYRFLKQFGFAYRLVFRFDYANLIHRILEHARFDMAQGGNLACGPIGGFLNHVPGMALRPV